MKLVGHERIEWWAMERLFCDIFPHLSNLVIFNLAYFCLGGTTRADHQFRKALIQEAFRRGLVQTPDVTSLDENVNLKKFTEKDVKSINILFACDQEEPTTEDSYVNLFTDRDRWEERNTPKRKRRATKKVK